jgi:hypothetical protein
LDSSSLDYSGLARSSRFILKLHLSSSVSRISKNQSQLVAFRL